MRWRGVAVIVIVGCTGCGDPCIVGEEPLWYADRDGDGYGDPGQRLDACEAPASFVADDSDCDDADAAVNAGGIETCDGVDNDCDGVADDGLIGAGAACPGQTCSDVLAQLGSADAGRFWIDPTGHDPFEVDCNMTLDGGGWTLVTGTMIQERDWMSFSVAAGAGLYDMRWADTGTFLLELDAEDSGCSSGTQPSMALRASVDLPFEFTEWFGTWTGSGKDVDSSHDDDQVDLGWGETVYDCGGSLRFGTDADTEKFGGEWGRNWNSDDVGPIPHDWEWDPTVVQPTRTFRWESIGQTPDDDLVISDISIWVREAPPVVQER